ncbi:unnamed protein product (macronuclear) [Paramecium tetraurelia]|uniref:EF-hand domain-containing protein n=1 Tax=Paramecium tetraurelia TaxID=5888 RepID=A0C5G7_PARTE|nr:uncharacterized protein GSPATT00006533001 [Paramecium tetraurelia]CAK66034.1 unnamed protein product [Paramecium tetraurelia]|eukprot:XP_001433431.1 hypothetical protein (macronuclear) [Paramecium tetraurelia strain d4-2]
MNTQKLPYLQSPKRPETKGKQKSLTLNLNIKDSPQDISTFRTTTQRKSHLQLPQSDRVKTYSDVSYLNFRNIPSHKHSSSTTTVPLSNIARDPQLYEFVKLSVLLQHNQASKTNIYASIIKENVKGTFIENPTELKMNDKTIDFSPLLQNIKIHQFKYYLQSILQQECKTIFDSKCPPNRQQAIDLLMWFDKMIQTLNTENLLLITDLTNQLQLVYQTCIHELARQVSFECKERGTLLLIIWNSFVSFIEMLINNVAVNFEEMETSQINTVQRIQRTHQTLVQQLQQEINQLKQQIEQLEVEKSDLSNKNIYLAKKNLQLTNEIKILSTELDEMTYVHNKVSNELLQTKLQIETNSSLQTQATTKIKIGIQEGQSVVAHLLSMKNTMYSKLQKKTSIQFEKVEQLREDEEYFKSGLSKTDIDQLNSTFQYQNMLKQQSKAIIPIITEDKDVQTDQSFSFLKDQIEDLFNQTQTDNQSDNQNSKNQIMQNYKEKLIQREQEVELKNKFIEQMLELQEHKVNAKYYEQTLQEATQEFIELLKKKKQKIKKLKKSQTQLQNRLNSSKIKQYFFQVQSESGSPKQDMPQTLITQSEMKAPSFRNSIIINQQAALQEDIIESDEQNEEDSIIHNQQQQENYKESNFDQDQFNNQQQNAIKEELSLIKNNIQEEDYPSNPDIQDNQIQESGNLKDQVDNNEINQLQEPNTQHSQNKKNINSSIRRKFSKRSQSKQNIEEVESQNQVQKTISPIKNSQNKKSIQIRSLSVIKDLDDEPKQQYLKRKHSKVIKQSQQQSNSTLNALDQSSDVNDSENLSLISSDDLSEKTKDDEIKKIRSLVSQYGGVNIQKRRFTKPMAFKLSLLSDQKKERRVKRVYSQNTDAANQLLHEVMNVKLKKHKDSIIPISSIIKIFNTIISDTAKNQEGYKIPLHVSIYDFFLKKYGFKNVAEKKIKQLLQFIFHKKSQYPKLCLISRLCYMDDEMDEAVYKLIVESIKYFHTKEIQLNKPEINLTHEQLIEYCNEFLQQLLGSQYITQLLQQLKQNTNKYIIFENIMIQVMNLYFQKKRQCQDILKLIFQAADLDGNNLIEFSEFKNLYKAIHPNIYDKNVALEQFISYADYIEELSKNKMITLPRFAEMAIELNLFSKEQINQYSKGFESLLQEWEDQKNCIKFRYLKAEKFPKVKFTFNLLTDQINLLKNKKQTTHDPQTLWVSYKLLQEKSQRVVLNHEIRECFFDLVPHELWIIQQGYRAIEELCI